MVLNNGSSTFSVFRNNLLIDSDAFAFAPRQDFSIGSSTNSTKILVTDIDLDGKPDVITSNLTTSTLSFFRNTSVPGSVSFAAAYNLATPSGAKYPVLGDLNKDGRMDIVMADQSLPGSLSIYVNNSTPGVINAATFLSRKSYIYGSGFVATYLVIADGDGDGRDDIIGKSNSPANVMLFKNNYTGGTFDSASLSYTYFVGNGDKIFCADVNMDGRTDLALVGSSGIDTRLLLSKLPMFRINDGIKKLHPGDTLSLLFSSGYTFSAGNSVNAYISDSLGSFNSPLLIGSKSTTNATDTVKIIIPAGVSGKNFRLRLTSSAPAKVSDEYGDMEITPAFAVVEPIDFSGKVGDTITFNGAALDKVRQVTFGTVDAPVIDQSAANLRAAVPYGANFRPVHFSDGAERITTNRNFSARHVGSANGMTNINPYFPARYFRPYAAGRYIALVDMDRDGDQDAVQLAGGYLYPVMNDNQDGVWTMSALPRLPGTYNTAAEVHIADLDNDGNSDILVPDGDNIYYFRNLTTAGTMSFDNPVAIVPPASVDRMKIADMNRDGLPDLIITSASPANRIIILYKGPSGNPITAGSFTMKWSATVSAPITSLAISDLNNDGFNEIVYTAGTSQFSVLQNLAGFMSPFVITTAGTARMVATDDINRDGRTDILLLTGTPSRIFMYRNNYAGGLMNAGAFDTIGIALGSFVPTVTVLNLMSADLDFDGKNDILLHSTDGSGNGQLSFYRNMYNGSTFTSASFAAPLGLSGPFMYLQCEIGDMNLDRRPDLVLPSSGSFGMMVRTNFIPVLSITAVSGYACRGEKLSINYNAAAGTFNAGNVFSVFVSDSAGKFGPGAQMIGSKVSTGSDTIRVTIPQNLTPGLKYKMRIVSSNPYCIGDSLLTLDLRYCPKGIDFFPDQAEPGGIITVTGTDFNPNPDSTSVFFGTAKGKVVSASTAQLQVIVPASVGYDRISLSTNRIYFRTKKYFTPIFRSSRPFDSLSLSTNLTRIFYNHGLLTNSLSSFADISGDGVKEFGFPAPYGTIAFKQVPGVDSFTTSTLSTSSLGGSVADLDADGTLDMCATSFFTSCPTSGVTFTLGYSYSRRAGGLYLFQGSSSQTYYAHSNNCYQSPVASCVEDLDRDGIPNIIGRQSNAPELTIFRRNFSPLSSPPYLGFSAVNSTTLNPPSSDSRNVLSIDFDGDSLPDLVTDGSVERNTTPKGSAAIPSYFTTSLALPNPAGGGGARETLTADLNNDGKPEVIYYGRGAMGQDSFIRIFPNASTPGSLAIGTPLNIGKSFIQAVRISDFNGDGKPDLVVVRFYDICIYLNTSTGGTISFAPPVTFPFAAYSLGASFIDIADVNNDKKPDLLFKKDSSIYFLANMSPVFNTKLVKKEQCRNDSIYAQVILQNMPFLVGNIFRLQLSDSSGTFLNPLTIAQKAGTGLSAITGVLPSQLPLGGRYRVRVTSTSPADTSFISADSFSVYPDFSPNLLSNIQRMGACTGDSVVLSLPNPDILNSFQWKLNGADIPGATATTYKVRTQGAYALKVMNNVCSRTTRDTFVSIYPLPPAGLTLTPLPNICSGDSITLKTTPGFGYVYKWYFNSALSFTSTASQLNIKSAGTYGVMVTDTNGCIAHSADTAVLVVSKPSGVMSASQPLRLCAGDSLILTGTAGAQSKYRWRLNGSFMVADTFQTLKIKAAGNYSVLVTDTNQCVTQSADTTVTVLVLPPVSMQASSVRFCAGDSAMLTVNQGTKFRYGWLLNNAMIPGDTLPVKTAKVSGRYAAVITDSNTCRNTSRDTLITVLPKPAATLTFIRPAGFCTGDSCVLGGPAGNKLTYAWRNNGVLLGADTFQTLITRQSGKYSLLLTDSNSCKNLSIDTQVTAYTVPIALVTGTPTLRMCEGDSIVLGVQSASVLTRWTWKRNGSNTGDTLATRKTKIAGAYSVTVTDNHQCNSTSRDTMVTVMTLPVATFSGGAGRKICAGDSLVLQAFPTTNVSYQWKRNGLLLPAQVTSQLVVKISGTYSLVIKDSNSCTSVSHDTGVAVFVLPVAGVSGGTGTKVCEGDSLLLQALPIANVSYRWKLDNALLPAAGSQLNAKVSGTYTVIVTDSNNCSSLPHDTIVTFYSLPSSYITPIRPVAFCDRDSTILAANAGTAYRYLWYKDAVPLAGDTAPGIIVKAPGAYAVRVTDANNCSRLSNDTGVSVFSRPPTPVITRNASQLVSSAASGNQWYFNGNLIAGASANVYTPAANGLYSVTTTNSNNCSSDAAAWFNWIYAGSAAPQITTTELLIYPNPNSGRFEVSLSAGRSKAVITIYNPIGHEVSNFEGLPGMTYEIDLGSHASGIYFLKAGGTVYKIVKQ